MDLLEDIDSFIIELSGEDLSALSLQRIVKGRKAVQQLTTFFAQDDKRYKEIELGKVSYLIDFLYEYMRNSPRGQNRETLLKVTHQYAAGAHNEIQKIKSFFIREYSDLPIQLPKPAKVLSGHVLEDSLEPKLKIPVTSVKESQEEKQRKILAAPVLVDEHNKDKQIVELKQRLQRQEETIHYLENGKVKELESDLKVLETKRLDLEQKCKSLETEIWSLTESLKEMKELRERDKEIQDKRQERVDQINIELEEENRRLREKNIQLQDRNADLTETLEKESKNLQVKLNQHDSQIKEEMEELRELNSFLTKRVSEMSNELWKKENPTPTLLDLINMYKPEVISKRFLELFENEWSSAFQELSVQKESQERIAETLLNIMMVSYTLSLRMSGLQLKNLQSIVKKDMLSLGGKEENVDELTERNKTLYELAISNIKELRKILAPPSIPSLKNLVLNNLSKEHNLSYSKESKMAAYVDACVELTWLMCTLDPPMHLETCKAPDPASKYFKPYTKSGKCVQYCVWPCLCLHSNGPILRKGVAQMT
ncbi:hypothetical protein ACJMK2_031212 [Sinanodonta woodiana]|uniref:Mitochondria-eating protein C-terminal domain-containing protein n=1 Tax=Sinanodonta woodiana TaxID=1069815 RepID=A0ABD3WY32_SINWO